MTRERDMHILRPLVAARASGLCENERCWSTPTELHHAMPRSRARHGTDHILDRWAVQQIDAGHLPELSWLKFLCKTCHDNAHSHHMWARQAGLMLAGSVSAKSGTPVYTGPDPKLAEMFPPAEVAA